MALTPGTRLGPYEITAQIGAGGIRIADQTVAVTVARGLVSELPSGVWHAGYMILHDGVTYEERGPTVTKERLRARTAKMSRELKTLGDGVEPA